jgi:dolichyl-phosphate-mannose--protein O-mannosyl transferase
LNIILEIIYFDVALSSINTLRYLNTQSACVYLDESLYEVGLGRQQITLHLHLDENNGWIVESYNEILKQ